MLNKIVGFLIYPKIIDLDINYNKHWIYKKISINEYEILFWGIGEINEFKKNFYTLSFPLSDSLETRNTIIKFNDKKIHVLNDWLGSIPIFYNKRDKIISTNINYCSHHKKSKYSIDDEGLSDYLDFGYSVFENTQIKEIKFLRYFSEISLDSDGLYIKRKEDIFITKILNHKKTTNYEVISNLNYVLKQKLNTADQSKLILPLSGGYDSRLLADLIENKNQIRAFTYGISGKQKESFEVKIAQQISLNLGIKWKQIYLDKYTNHIDEWLNYFGISCHLHGMYQIDFYKKIFNEIKNTSLVVSGIFGDIWSTSDNFKKINTPNDLIKIGYTHGLNFNHNSNKKPSKNLESFFKQHSNFINHPKIQPLYTIRLKIILISYLLSLPEIYGKISVTPFLDFKSAVKILSLSEENKKDRKWLKDYLSKIPVNQTTKMSYSNTLDFDTWNKYSFKTLEHISNKDNLSYLVKDLNEIKVDFFSKIFRKLQDYKVSRFLINKLKLDNYFLKKVRKYQTLYPLNYFFKKYSS